MSEPRDLNNLIAFLNAIPTTMPLYESLEILRNALRDLLGDVDSVSINVNISCMMSSTDRNIYGAHTTQGVIQSSGVVQTIVTNGEDERTHYVRVLEGAVKMGYPIEKYHYPCGFDYDINGDYLGTIFLWAERDKPKVSQETLSFMKSIESFIVYLLSSLLLRYHFDNPHVLTYKNILKRIIFEADLTVREQEVLGLYVYGHTYKEIAEKLCVSLAAVKKRVIHIHRKAGVQSQAELFAKYFAPLLRGQTYHWDNANPERK